MGQMRLAVATMVIAVCVSGCASTFQSDIEVKEDQATLAIPNCEAAKHDVDSSTSSSLRDASPILIAVLPELRSAVEGKAHEKRSDLQIGVAIIALAGSLSRSRDHNDQRNSQKLSDALGMNLASFAPELPFASPVGIKDVTDSLDALNATDMMSPDKSGVVKIPRNEWHALMDSVANATETHGWTSNMAISLGAFARLYVQALGEAGYADRRPLDERLSVSRSVATDARVVAAKETLDKATILAAYFQAYFRSGAIFEANFDGQGLENDLMSELKKVVSDQNAIAQLQTAIKNVNASFETKLCGRNVGASGTCTIVGDVGEQTFVTRAGKSYGFPGITATIDPTATKKISTNRISGSQIAEDLIRVLVEGVGDAASNVPGVATSTLCTDTKLKRCATDSQSQVIQQVNNIGDETEATTNEVVSQLVRGTWLFALNNEALANSITTFVSVGARKLAEAAAWKAENGQKCVLPARKGESSGATLYQGLTIDIEP